MKFKSILLILFVLAASILVAEEAKEEEPDQQLSTADVSRFIKSFPLLQRDFERLGAKFNARDGFVAIPDSLKSSGSFLTILKTQGWGAEFFDKFVTIIRGYATIAYGVKNKEESEDNTRAVNEKDIELLRPHIQRLKMILERKTR